MVCSGLKAMFIDEGEIDDLPLVLVSPSEGSAVGASYITGWCLQDQRNTQYKQFKQRL